MPDLPSRDARERRLTAALARLSAAQLDRVLTALGDPPDPARVPAELWNEIGAQNEAALRPALVDIAMVSAGGLLVNLRARTLDGRASAAPAPSATVFIPGGRRQIAFEWGIVNTRAARWARAHTFDLVRQLNDTTRDKLQRATEKFFAEQLDMAGLRQLIEPSFGPARAKRIAETEVTRAAVQGELSLVAEVEQHGMRMIAVFNTSNDELVCPVCGPRNQKQRGQGWTDDPPAHPRCRCWLNHVPAMPGI